MYETTGHLRDIGAELIPAGYEKSENVYANQPEHSIHLVYSAFPVHMHVLYECAVREFCIDNLLVRIHFIIVMIRWTGLAPWEFEFPFPGCLTATFLEVCLCIALPL